MTTTTRSRRVSRPGFAATVAATVVASILSFATWSTPAHAQELSATVAPSTDLVDGQVVDVSGSEFAPNHLVGMAVCLAGATGRAQCDIDHIGLTTSDSTGGFSQDFAVPREIRLQVGQFEFETHDCALTACVLGVAEVETGGTIGRTIFLGIDFANPQLTIAIQPIGTLEAGTNLAVVRATVSCDHATPVSLAATARQPLTDPNNEGIAGEFSFVDQPCTPSEPILAFFPTRFFNFQNIDFALGPAAVSVEAQPLTTYSVGRPSTVAASAMIELIDNATVETAIRQLIADPANTQLRAALERAIRARVAQDPDFRREFIEALNNSSSAD